MQTRSRAAWRTMVAIVLVGTGATVLNAQPEKAAAPGAQPAKAADKSADKKAFSIDGYYLESCSCKAPCPCELTGPNMSCEGVGAYSFDKGTYDGQDFSGNKVAYALHIGESVYIYIDQPDAKKRGVAEKFIRAALAGFGPCKGVSDAKVEITGKDGNYTAKVDGGKIMTCTTAPVLGGDGKTPVTHSNTQDAMNPVMCQGTCVSCTYTDADRKITLEKGRNAYFNQHMKSSGKL